MTIHARCVMQQVLHGRLQIAPETEESSAEYVEIQKGIVIFVCFLKGFQADAIPKTVNSLLNVKLSYCDERKQNVSILELPGDILIVPQATLGGKMKGKNTQYHSNIAKEDGLELYREFVRVCKDLVENNSLKEKSDRKPTVKHGTYGNRQVLNIETNGPYTHVFDF